jgi:hypothetical protein
MSLDDGDHEWQRQLAASKERCVRGYDEKSVLSLRRRNERNRPPELEITPLFEHPHLRLIAFLLLELPAKISRELALP